MQEMDVITWFYLGLHLSGLLWVNSQDVLVMPDGVLAILILGTHVLLQGLQDAVGLRGEGEGEREKEKERGGVVEECYTPLLCRQERLG